VAALRQMAEDPKIGQATVASLRNLVGQLGADEELEVATGTGGAFLAWELRFNATLRLTAVLQGTWDVAASVSAARRWGDADLAREVAQLGPKVQADARQADVGGESAPLGELADPGWPAVPALAVLLAVAIHPELT